MRDTTSPKTASISLRTGIVIFQMHKQRNTDTGTGTDTVTDTETETETIFLKLSCNSLRIHLQRKKNQNKQTTDALLHLRIEIYFPRQKSSLAIVGWLVGWLVV